MAETTSRRYRRVCSLCNASCEPAHVVVLVRQASGAWRRLYRTCWDCGWAELQRIREVHGEDQDWYRYHYVLSATGDIR